MSKKKEESIKIIKEIMKKNKGYVSSKEIDEMGIHREYLNDMWKKGLLEKVASGLYMDPSNLVDNYFIFSKTMPNVIYSHMTALYFHGLSIKAPNGKYDITIKKNYNSVHLKGHEVFYTNEKIFNIGLTYIKTPMGNLVKCYDIERSICDIIRSKNRMDFEHIKYSVKEYVKRSDKDLVKLSTYAEAMGIKKEVMDFVGLFYE